MQEGETFARSEAAARRVVLVSGIFPPDVGGPATHASDLREELLRRGYRVSVLTLGDDIRRARREEGVVRFPRSWPVAVRMVAVAGWLATNGRRFDAIYATGMHVEAVVGARLAGRPVVVKVVGDEAWERGRRLGLTSDTFDEFQGPKHQGSSIRVLRWIRNSSLRLADAIVTPSEYLARIVERWLGGPADIQVIHNGVRAGTTPTVGVSSERSSRDPDSRPKVPLRVVFVGRLVNHKRVDAMIEAIAQTDEINLDVVGEGPERAHLESRARKSGVGDRVRFLGVQTHEEVLRTLSRSEVLLLASDYEGLPHVVVEAISVGLPVLAPRVGGTDEVLADNVNGLCLEDGLPATIAKALMQLRDDEDLLRRLSEGALATSVSWSLDSTTDGVERVVARARRRKPRAVFLGKTRFAGGDTESISSRLEILVHQLDPVLVNSGPPGVALVGTTRMLRLPTGRPRAISSALFYVLGPAIALGFAARRRPSVVVCQSPYEAIGVLTLVRALPASLRPLVVTEVHGDWRTASRLYGSPGREIAAPLADRLARWAVLRSDRVRVIGDFTRRLVEQVGYSGPLDVFVAHGDYAAFASAEPVAPPSDPRVLFVGALEPYKGVDVLLDAWATVIRLHPDAMLTIVGAGSRQADLHARAKVHPGSVELVGTLSSSSVRNAMDRCRVLVLPSRSEGLGRVVIEAFARARPVVASNVGGLPELVEHGVTGLLVPTGDPESLGRAIVELLSDPERCATMGLAARERMLDLDEASSFPAGISRLARAVATSKVGDGD